MDEQPIMVNVPYSVAFLCWELWRQIACGQHASVILSAQSSTCMQSLDAAMRETRLTWSDDMPVISDI